MDDDDRVPSRTILSLGCKLIGIYFFVHLASVIPFYVWQYDYSGGAKQIYAVMTTAGVQFCLVVVLLFASDWLAALLVRDDESLSMPPETVQGVLMAVFLLIGLIWLGRGLPEVLVTGNRAIYNGTTKLLDHRWFESLVEVLFGFGIVLSARKGTRMMTGEATSLLSGLPDDFPSNRHIPFMVLVGVVVLFFTLYIVL